MEAFVRRYPVTTTGHAVKFRPCRAAIRRGALLHWHGQPLSRDRAVDADSEDRVVSWELARVRARQLQQSQAPSRDTESKDG